AERFQLADETRADIVRRHRKELSGRQPLITEAAHRPDKSGVGREAKLAHAVAPAEEPGELDRARLALEAELRVRPRVRVEAVELAERDVEAHLKIAPPPIGPRLLAAEREPEHRAPPRLPHLR